MELNLKEIEINSYLHTHTYTHKATQKIRKEFEMIMVLILKANILNKKKENRKLIFLSILVAFTKKI
jgi:hypothetical protein